MAKIKILALDLDGTTLRSDHTVSSENATAIKVAQEAGIRVCFATGRIIFSVRGVAESIGFTGPMVCCNGSHVLNDQHDLVSTTFLSDTLTARTLDFAVQTQTHVSAYSPEGVLTLGESKYLDFYRSHIRRVTPQIITVDELKGTPLFKIVLVDDPSRIREHRVTLDNMFSADEAQITESAPHYLEILPASTNKGIGLMKLANHYNVDKSEVAAIGDYRNDLEMLEWAGLSGAVSNALPEVKSRADVLVSSNDESGVAEFIHRYVLQS